MNIDKQFGDAPLELHEEVESKLLFLAGKLFEIERVFHGEMGSDARVVWLTARTVRLDTAKQVRSALQHVAGVVSWIDNWSDCAKGGSPSTDDDWALVNEAGAAANDALKALHALIDHVIKVYDPNMLQPAQAA